MIRRECAIFRHGLPELATETVRGALLGNFDGFHVGHQALIRALTNWQRSAPQRESSVISFYPHPLTVLRGIPVPRLTALRQNRDLLSNAGIDSLLLIRFTKALADLTAREFIEQILFQHLQLEVLFCGSDATVGKNREGNIEVLQQIFAEHGKQLVILPFQELSGNKIGSGLIRQAVAAGNVAHARDMLGRYFAIQGIVRHGDARGKSLGFPTANISPGAYQLPESGVYATIVTIAGTPYTAVTNVGTRPTVDGSGVRIESYLLTYSGADFYGERITVAFHSKLRPEIRFPDVKALQDQIQNDVKSAASYFLNKGI